MKPSIGRADLLTLWNRFQTDGLEQMAPCLNYFLQPEENAGEPQPQKKQTLPVPPPVSGSEPRVEHRFAGKESFVHFWRVQEYKEVAAEKSRLQQPQWLQEVDSFKGHEHDMSGDPKVPAPLAVPLMPWSRLWPFLYRVLGCLWDSRRLDVDEVIHRVSRLQPLQRIPFQKHFSWASNCQLIFDVNPRLMPFWEDDAQLLKHIERLRGVAGLEVLSMENGPLERCRYLLKGGDRSKPYSLPAPGTPILVISDLGCLDIGQPGASTHGWREFGKRLNRAGFKPFALTPCPPRLWQAELLPYWKMVNWDRASVRSGEFNLPGAGVRQLLTLLSPAIRIEPPLLRALRLLLPAGVADVATEAQVWHHPHIHATPLGLMWEPLAVARYRNRFANDVPLPLGQQVIALIKKYHAHLSPSIIAEEDVIAATLGQDGKEPGKESRQHVRRIVKTLCDPGFSYRQSLGHFVTRMGTRAWEYPDMWRICPELKEAWVIQHMEEVNKGCVSLPPGTSFHDVAWVLEGEEVSFDLHIKQRGEHVVIDPKGGAIADRDWNDRGCPMISSHTRQGWLLIDSGNEKGGQTSLIEIQEAKAVDIDLPQQGTLKIETAEAQVLIKSFVPPGWADEICCNEEGLSVKLSGAKREQRLFWLAPGRHSDVVVIDKGCWMDEMEFKQIQRKGITKPKWADTFGVDKYGVYADFSIHGVTQRMRLILPGDFMMGSPENEVDIRENETLNHVILTRSFWLADTACTQELWQAVISENPSKFKGPLLPVDNVSWEDCQSYIETINGLKPGLDLRLPTEAQWEYACRAGTHTPFWFGDNITPEQVNYDGNYPYSGGKKGLYREKTVDVKTLPCNGWGLYQMHGNVWEWCEDWYGDYSRDVGIDPEGADKGEYRVIRGGSWSFIGGFVRSALRDGDDPALHWDGTGFRFAGGQKETGG